MSAASSSGSDLARAELELDALRRRRPSPPCRRPTSVKSIVTTSPFCAGRAGSGALSARVPLAERLELLVDHAVSSTSAVGRDELEALELHVLDLGLHLEARLVRERLRSASNLPGLDLRAGSPA